MDILPVTKHALMITFFVFVMMVLVDFINMASKKRMGDLLQGGQWRQYILASILGSTPGCLGAFMNVSLYVHGMISFGAIVGGMIATSGDEAFVMLVQFPGTALYLFALLFLLGIVFAWISDRLINILGITPCESCLSSQCEQCESQMNDQEDIGNYFQATNITGNLKSLSFTRFLFIVLITSFFALVVTGILGPAIWNWKRITFAALSFTVFYITLAAPEHYLHDHIWDHIIKKHILRVFLWTLGALLFVDLGLQAWHLESFVHQNMIWILVVAALVGMIPESGPHLVFVMMYAKGIIPFSVLLTTSFIQDGHGMLPMLSYSLKDSVLIKTFNLVFGLGIGSILFMLGF
jgi:hypothetical protein